MGIAGNRWVRHRLSLPSWISAFWLMHVTSFTCLGRGIPYCGSAIFSVWIPLLWRCCRAKSMMVPGLYTLLWGSTKMEMVVIGGRGEDFYEIRDTMFHRKKTTYYTIATLVLKYKPSKLLGDSPRN